ncbi:hypothetical protein [Teredinibacter sp. KSP-S5-2]|uniref:hypothetical protein n=1 Tax=Teredinibacter sp. KSP-S5-2 TaxID=3034506 RepID=UPI0029344D07|nr:hypothetical protein [Teredinibacter sp. KSP-S5-2]WNO10593.1 hypothetical protein P5V12_05340 [Teredinibacter sp. KSP-S5-2]
MSIEDISIETAEVDWQKCLQHWSWILKKCPEFNILLVTKFGEIFTKADDGAIWFLSTSNASYEPVASSQEELAKLLENQEEYEYFFMPRMISVLEQSLGLLEHGNCYGFHVPCVFEECTFESSNFKVISLESYLIGLGDMLGKLQSTPSGEKVFIHVEE